MSRARHIAIKALTRVERERAFAAAALEAELKTADPRDAALATELVLGTLRKRRWLDTLLDRASRQGKLAVDPAVREILRLSAYQLAFLGRIPSHAAVNEAVDEIRKLRGPRLAGFANAVLHKLSADRAALVPREKDAAEMPAVVYGLPDWLFEKLVTAFGRERAVAMGRAFDGPSRRTLRIDTSRIDVESALLRLGADATAGLYLSWAVDAKERGSARALEEDGLASHQDEGAGLVVAALDPKEGETILDACAGRGGKTALIAQLAGKTAALYASDLQKSKLQRLEFDLARQGRAATTAVWDLASTPCPFSGPFDRVLVDAPCSGTGTLGRRPEIRWKLEPGDVVSLAALQKKMLAAAARLVKPGGRLVFAVCSVLPDEHVAHLEGFLSEHRDFSLVAEPPALWPASIPWNGGAPLVDPGESRTDGYGVLCFDRSRAEVP